jgi:chemotaxis protein histidine kinase CheA
MAQSDPTLLELFRGEMETHVPTLTSGLLALEKDPHLPGQIEAIMRAAHSIKGAARIVGQELIGEIAHVMEDSFTAAGRGELTVSADLIDAMLRGVDLMQRLADGDSTAQADVPTMVKLLSDVREGKTAAAAPRPQPVKVARPVKADSIVLPAVLDSAGVESVRAQAAGAGDTVRLDASHLRHVEPVALTLFNTLAQQRDLIFVSAPASLARLLHVTQLDRLARVE